MLYIGCQSTATRHGSERDSDAKALPGCAISLQPLLELALRKLAQVAQVVDLGILQQPGWEAS